MTSSHAQFMSRYAAAFPASVQATPEANRFGSYTAYRIAGLRTSVQAEIDRITDGLPAYRYWFIGPVLWGEEWIAHGEVRHRAGRAASR